MAQILEDKIPIDPLVTAMFTVASAIFLYLAHSSVYEIKLFYIPVPKTAFAYPLIFATFVSVGTVLDIDTGDTSETILTTVLFATAVLFYFDIWMRNDYFDSWWDALMAIAVVFFYNICCSVLLNGYFKSPDKSIIKIPGDNNMVLKGSHLVFCVIVIAAAVGIIGNLKGAVCFVLKNRNFNQRFVKAVRENALTEYKMLRFVWLWIYNSEFDWHLLLQVDSSEDIGMMWDDCGRVYLWITDEDLAAMRFENTWVILQCF